ncbi:helix-turn-helix domain-containing protein [Pseudoramibacter faecis]|uniref:helix-turn-helix domain-containing protein n=1 Tax=Pseudoramibacter faecis TaxID=3108534 RepID=UPI003CC99C1D
MAFAMKYGVTKTALKYNTYRQYVYRWLRRYDGTIESLRDRSRRPHHHPNQHMEQELKLIRDMRRRNPNAALVVFWVKLRQRGYSPNCIFCARLHPLGFKNCGRSLKGKPTLFHLRICAGKRLSLTGRPFQF